MNHIPLRKFSEALCKKFPEQTERHLATPANARWMLRNPPTSPFALVHKAELIAVINLAKE